MFKRIMKSLFKIAWRKFIAAEWGSKEEDFWNSVCAWLPERDYT